MNDTLFFCCAPDDEHAKKHLIKHDVNPHYSRSEELMSSLNEVSDVNEVWMR